MSKSSPGEQTPHHEARGERVQKILARAGHGSRREIEQWIRDGRVSVNGRLIALGATASDDDKIEVDGKRLRIAKQTGLPKVIALHKPVGYVCSTRPENDCPSVFSLLPRLENRRWISVGRLDINTSGILLFTDNGDLANRLMHPRYRIDREYAVRIFGTLSDEQLGQLTEGIEIDSEHYALDDLVLGDGRGANRWYYCVVRQGRNREVRKIWESQGVTVSRLARVRFGNIILPRKLAAGKYIDIEGEQLSDLCQLVNFRAGAKSSRSNRQRAER